MNNTPRFLAPPASHRAGLGFSLIEILVAVAAIIILISIAIPVLNRVKQNSDQAKCASNLRQIGIGMSSYIADNNGLFPLKGPAGSGRKSTPHWLIAKYLYPERFAAGDENVVLEGVFRCPAWDPKTEANIAYTPSKYLRLDDGSSSSVAPEGLRYQQLNNLARLLVWTEHRGLIRGPTETQTYTNLSERHNGKLNILFGDFHVEAFTKDEITGSKSKVVWDWRK